MFRPWVQSDIWCAEPALPNYTAGRKKNEEEKTDAFRAERICGHNQRHKATGSLADFYRQRDYILPQ